MQLIIVFVRVPLVVAFLWVGSVGGFVEWGGVVWGGVGGGREREEEREGCGTSAPCLSRNASVLHLITGATSLCT